MPRFEISVILRILARPDAVATMKNLLEPVLKDGNIVRKIQCLGSRGLPTMKTMNGEKHTDGTYFVLDVECPENTISIMKDNFMLHKNVISAFPLSHKVVYENETPCGGMNEPDYVKLLEDLKKSGKFQRKPQTHPYVK